jgi:hypothetical protein
VNSQYDLPANDPLANHDEKAGDKKLAKLYGTMGFKPVRGHAGYMFASSEELYRRFFRKTTEAAES